MPGEKRLASSHQAAAIENRAAKRKKRRFWRVLSTLALLAAFVWLLPTIICHTPLLGWIVRKATADVNGTVTVNSVASPGWFSTLIVTGIDVKDADGKPVAQISAAFSEKTLFEMLRNPSDLGRFYIKGTTFFVELDDDGSNVDKLLENYMSSGGEEEQSTEDKSASPIGFSLQIDDAALKITDRPTDRTWQIDKLSLVVDMTSGISGAILAKLSAELPDVQTPGKISCEARIDGRRGEASLEVVNLPLAMFRAPIARFESGTTVTGLLSTTAKATWGDEAKGGNRLLANLNLTSFLLTTPALENDRVALDRARGACKISWTDKGLEIEETTLDCDVGNLTAKGTIPFGKEGEIDLDALLTHGQTLEGNVDLARLARMLPTTLHIRQGMRIDSGRVNLNATVRPEARGTIWRAKVQAAGLTADSNGRKITWQQPVMLNLEAHQEPQGTVVDSLLCESDFLKLRAAGTIDRLEASLTFSLNRLTEQLGQFVDLSGLHLAGEGSGRLNWNRKADKRFDAGAELTVANFQMAATGKPAWIEPNLTLSASASGRSVSAEQTGIDAASLSLTTATDRLGAKLIAPVADYSAGPWPISLDMQGKLQNWPARLAPWIDTGDMQLAGDYTLETEATFADSNVFLRRLKLAAKPLRVASSYINTDEPSLNLNVSGSWEGEQRRLRLDHAGFSCGTVAAAANSLIVSLPESGTMEMSGSLSYEAFLGRLKNCFADPKKPSDWRVAGQLKGSAQFQQSGDTIRGSMQNDIVNLTIVDSSGEKFQEPLIKFAAAGDYDGQSKVLQLTNCEMTSRVLAARVAGRANPVGDHQEANINGSMRYDVARLADLMRPYLGSGITFIGQGQSPIWYRGPFSLAEGSAGAGMSWKGANIHGFQIGPGELKAAMAQGLLKVDPLDLTVSRGRMHLAPQIQLTTEPMMLTMPAGPLMQNVQISPAMCSSFLKYIAPVLADVATAQGSFSIVMDQCRVPLTEPKKSTIKGRFVIHSIQVGPGSLIRELAVLLGRESPARLKQESVVTFWMQNQRVHHRDLELIFPDLTIRTSGSVGLDQTMNLVAEMPIPPKWLVGNALAANALANQQISIPIKGTLSKPQLDRRRMEQLNRELIKKAAGGLLEGLLNK